jgi:hypothetical protein
LSATKELEPGFRAILLLAEGLFRLDVLVSGDTLRTVVRNLSAGELVTDAQPSADAGVSIGVGDVAAYEPGRTQLSFTLGTGSDRVLVSATVATLRFADRGKVRVTGQAIIRHAPVR